MSRQFLEKQYLSWVPIVVTFDQSRLHNAALPLQAVAAYAVEAYSRPDKMLKYILSILRRDNRCKTQEKGLTKLRLCGGSPHYTSNIWASKIPSPLPAIPDIIDRHESLSRQVLGTYHRNVMAHASFSCSRLEVGSRGHTALSSERYSIGRRWKEGLIRVSHEMIPTP